MDARALYNWQVSPGHFAALGCTGIESTTRPAWRPASGEFATTLPDVCILRNGITQSSVNSTNKGSGWDGAILLSPDLGKNRSYGCIELQGAGHLEFGSEVEFRTCEVLMYSRLFLSSASARS